MEINDHILLRFDWKEVDWQVVSAVLGQSETTLNDGTLGWDAIALVVDDRAVTLTVNIDTDELIVSQGPLPTGEGERWSDIAALEDIVGHKIGWCWTAKNSQGYFDAFAIAFDGIEPNYLFVGIASSIHCSRILPLASALKV
jgi:hypothetical protein